jgi:hypothetical protein
MLTFFTSDKKAESVLVGDWKTKAGVLPHPRRKSNKKCAEANEPPIVGAFDDDERTGQGLLHDGRTMPKRWNKVSVRCVFFSVTYI